MDHIESCLRDHDLPAPDAEHLTENERGYIGMSYDSLYNDDFLTGTSHPILSFYICIIFYYMVVVSNSSSGVTGCRKWDVEKGVEAYTAVVHQSQEDVYAFVRNACDTGVFHWKLYNGIVLLLSLHLQPPSWNSSSPLPSPPSPWTQLIIT